jgi:hypothetical protein
MPRKVLSKFEKDVIRTSREGLKKATRVVHNKIVDYSIRTDHTLKQLAELGHPYSARHPIALAGHKPFEVHKQSGTLFEAIRIVEEDPDTFAVGVDPAKVPYLDAVILGTARMVARNFPLQSYLEVKPQIKVEIDQAIKKVM